MTFYQPVGDIKDDGLKAPQLGAGFHRVTKGWRQVQRGAGSHPSTSHTQHHMYPHIQCCTPSREQQVLYRAGPNGTVSCVYMKENANRLVMGKKGGCW